MFTLNICKLTRYMVSWQGLALLAFVRLQQSAGFAYRSRGDTACTFVVLTLFNAAVTSISEFSPTGGCISWLPSLQVTAAKPHAGHWRIRRLDTRALKVSSQRQDISYKHYEACKAADSARAVTSTRTLTCLWCSTKLMAITNACWPPPIAF